MTWQDIEGAREFIAIVAAISFISTFWGIYKNESYIVSFITSAIITTVLSLAIYLFPYVYYSFKNTSGLIEGCLALAASVFFTLLGLPILIIYIAIGIICGSIPGLGVACCLRKYLKTKKRLKNKTLVEFEQ